jgi:outer membrane protein assembly factor BamB
MTDHRKKTKSRGAAAVLAIGLVVALVGCAEKDDILIGDREDLRGDQSLGQLPAAPLDRPIRLPSAVQNADWTGPIGTNRPQHAALSSSPQLIWSTRIGAGNSRKNRMTSPPVVGGGLIYGLDALAVVSAVSPQGDVAWSVDLADALGSRDKISGAAMTYHGGVLYVSSGYGAVAAIDGKTGSIKWIQKLGGTGGGAPLVRDNLVYLISGDDTAWALRTDNGRIAWQLDGTTGLSTILGAPAPAWSNGLVVFGFGSGDLVATFPKGGLVRWSAAVAGQRPGRSVSKISDVTGSPVAAGGRVYAANHSGRIIAVDGATGELLWTAREGSLDPVWPVGGSLFALSDLNQLLRINAGDGSVIWAAELPGYVKDRPRKRGAQYAHYGPVLAGGALVVASSDGVLRFFDPASGALKSTTKVPGGAASGVVVAGQTLYVMGGKGDLHAFR